MSTISLELYVGGPVWPTEGLLYDARILIGECIINIINMNSFFLVIFYLFIIFISSCLLFASTARVDKSMMNPEGHLLM